MTVLIDLAPLWYFQTNAYVVAPQRGGPAVVVDAPPDPDGVGRLLAEHDLTPVAVLVSHGHIDHVGGIDGLVSPTVTAYLHPDDVDMARHPGEQLRALLGQRVDDLGSELITAPFTDLSDGQRLDLAGMSFDVLFTPGHTPGHCCFYMADEAVLFSGDHPGGSYDTLMASMASKVLPLPDETRVLPGHGPTTTLAAERRLNPFLQELL